MSWFTARPRIEQLVTDHYEELYRFAYRLSGAAAEAEDLVQETFCQAQLKLSQLRDGQAARAWLFAILRNNYLRRLRDTKLARHLPLDEVGEVADRPENELPPIDAEQLQEALGSLPEAFRTPLVLYYFEEFSYREIAEQMQVPMGTVMSRLARGKDYLRSRLLGSEEALAGVPREEA